MNRFCLVFLAFCCTVSCVMLDLSVSDADAVDSRVSFECVWPDVNARLGCDSVYVLMNRSTDGVRYLYASSSGETIPDTTAIFGQYVAMSYSLNTDDYQIEGRADFLFSSLTYIRDFTAQTLTVPMETVESLRGNSGLDFNASYKFIAIPTQIYSSSSLVTVSDVADNNFRFNFTPVLTNLKLRLVLRAEPGVSITSVSGEISGVPASINIKDASTSAEDLARIIFPMARSTDGTCTADLLVTGLYPSESAELLTGPGILRLCVSASFSGSEKILHPALNLRDLIMSKKVMVPAVQEGRYVTSSRSLELAVTPELLVGQDSFISTGGGDGVGQWFDSDVLIDVEL